MHIFSLFLLKSWPPMLFHSKWLPSGDIFSKKWKKGKNAFISNWVIGVVTKSSAALASLQT